MSVSLKKPALPAALIAYHRAQREYREHVLTGRTEFMGAIARYEFGVVDLFIPPTEPVLAGYLG